MARDSKKNDPKVRRLTNRQKVLSVYPNAFYYGGIISARMPIKASWKEYEIYQSVDLSSGTRTSYDAWKEAWKAIQKTMVLKLEN